MRKLSLFIYVIIAAQLILLQSCSKKDSSSSSSTSASYKITGKITGNGISSRSSLATSATSTPDKIVCMYNHGQSSKEFTIQSDGSFEVDTSLLDKNDLVIFVVNSTSKTIFGHLNLKASNDEKLELLDTSKMEKDLSLGNVDSTDNCSSTETLSTTTSFKSNELDNLQKISRNDDPVALYSNNWRNPNFDASANISFSLDNLTNVINNYSSVDNFSKTNNYNGIGPTITGQLDSAGSLYTDNSSPFTDTGNAVTAYLYPPSAIKHSDKQPSSTSPTSDNLSYDADNTTPIGLRSRDTVWWSNDGKTIAVISYLTIIGLIIAYVMNNDKKTEFGAYHIRQSVGLAATGIALGVVGLIPILGWIISILGTLLLLYMWIMGLINAMNEKKKPLPFFGKKFEEWFKSI